MMNKRLCLLLNLVVIFLAAIFYFPKRADAKAVDRKTQTELKNYLRNNQINGIILVNGKGSRPLVLQNSVTTKREQVVKPTRLFPIGSLQKLITGVAIYHLVKRSDLDWNTPLSKYYPQINGSNQITIHQLMTHTSGLQNDGTLPKKILRKERDQEKFFLDHFTVINNHDWNYQDIDFEMLAAMIRRQTHSSYYHYVRNNIFRPLKLHQLRMIYQAKRSQVVSTMQPGVTWQMLTQTASAEMGAGDLLISPLDYWDFIYKEVLGNQKLMQSFASQPTSQREAYFGGVYFQGDVIHANGNEPGYNSCLFADYRNKRVLLFFANNIDYHTLRRVGEELYEIYYGGQLQY